jgi:hypothetical protein
MSLSTNFHDPGTHHEKRQTLLQVPLQLLSRQWRFRSLSDSPAVYDAYLEILPEKLKEFSRRLQQFDFAVDFYGKKDLGQVTNEFVLTSKASKDPIVTYGRELKPVELNVIFEIKGNDIALTKKDNFSADTANEATVFSWFDEANTAYYYNIPREFLYSEGVKAAEKFYNEYYQGIISDKERIIQSIYSSRSWRLTAPLRWIAGYIRKLQK